VYRGIGDAVRGIVAHRGVGGLYRGLNVTLLEIVPYAALQFGCYDALTAAYSASRSKLAPKVGPFLNCTFCFNMPSCDDFIDQGACLEGCPFCRQCNALLPDKCSCLESKATASFVSVTINSQLLIYCSALVLKPNGIQRSYSGSREAGRCSGGQRGAFHLWAIGGNCGEIGHPSPRCGKEKVPGQYARHPS